MTARIISRRETCAVVLHGQRHSLVAAAREQRDVLRVTVAQAVADRFAQDVHDFGNVPRGDQRDGLVVKPLLDLYFLASGKRRDQVVEGGGERTACDLRRLELLQVSAN